MREAAPGGKRSKIEGGGATLLHLCQIFWLFMTTFWTTMTTFGRNHDNFLAISWQLWWHVHDFLARPELTWTLVNIRFERWSIHAYSLKQIRNWRNYDATYSPMQISNCLRVRERAIPLSDFYATRSERLPNNTKQKIEIKNLQILKSRITKCSFTAHYNWFLVHSLPKCSFSDKSVRYRTFSAHLVVIRPIKHLEAMDWERCRNENFLADYQAVTRKLKKYFAWNLDFWCPTMHLWIINGDTRSPPLTKFFDMLKYILVMWHRQVHKTPSRAT